MLKQYKTPIFNLTTVALAVGLGYSFYQQFNIENKLTDLSQVVLFTNNNLTNINRNIILALKGGEEMYYDVLSRDNNQLNINKKQLFDFYKTNESLYFVKSKKEFYDTINRQISNLMKDLSLIIDNKNVLLNFEKIIKENNIIFSELDLMKSSIENHLRSRQEFYKTEPKVTKAINDSINLLNVYLNKIKEIKDNFLLHPVKHDEYKIALNNIISYIDNNLGEVEPNNMILQKLISEYSSKTKQLRDKLYPIIDDRYDFKTLSNIYKNNENYVKNIAQIQRDLIEVGDNKTNNFYYYLIIVMIIALLIKTFVFVNAKAELSKKDYNKIKQFESLNKRTQMAQNSIDRIIRFDSYSNFPIIETGAYLDEEPFRESRLGIIVSKFNSLLKSHASYKYKVEILGKTAQDLAMPTINLLPILKKENGNSTNAYALNEIVFSAETVKDIKENLDSQKIKLDVLNNNSQNLSYNLEEVGNILTKNKEHFFNTRSNIQNSSKQIKKIGEISQKINDVQEDMRDVIAKMEVIALNLAVESAQKEDGNFSSTLAKELQTLLEEIQEQNYSLKSRIEEIQVNSKDTADLLEKTTNGIVNDTELLDKSKTIVNSLVGYSVKVEEVGEELFDIEEKIENLIKMLDEKMDTAREKDGKKSEVILKCEQALNRILETLNG